MISFNKTLLAFGAGALFYATNPNPSSHRHALGPLFVDYVNSIDTSERKGAHADWTFLPESLDYADYYFFSTTMYPAAIPTRGTPAEGTLTLGLLGKVFVFFPQRNQGPGK